ncbi:uncharacterized protein LODBEIA_P36280 [Lodderomyces beijingensis]|uniref:Plasma membrane proteolipid 3 n=1 Tax=Lodderomyces beijingensis TaxID=1775926 RepID=A0ABP0ZMN3_9ASCO
MCICLSDLFLIVLSVFFPPLPVWIRRGLCSKDSLINVLLMILGYFPGLIHSWYIIAKYPPYWHEHESKVYYVYRDDLEHQSGPPGGGGRGRGRGRSRREQLVGPQGAPGHVPGGGSTPHCHHHHHCPDENTVIRTEPQRSNAQFTYGAVNEGSSSQGLFENSRAGDASSSSNLNSNSNSAPPAYTEFDNKTQR